MVNPWLDLLYKLIIGNERALLDQVANQLKAGTDRSGRMAAMVNKL